MPCLQLKGPAVQRALGSRSCRVSNVIVRASAAGLRGSEQAVIKVIKHVLLRETDALITVLPLANLNYFLGTFGSIWQVFGVGGGGSNAVNNMINNDIQGIEFWVANTDAQVSQVWVGWVCCFHSVAI
jgi:hypothetical protein